MANGMLMKLNRSATFSMTGGLTNKHLGFFMAMFSPYDGDTEFCSDNYCKSDCRTPLNPTPKSNPVWASTNRGRKLGSKAEDSGAYPQHKHRIHDGMKEDDTPEILKDIERQTPGKRKRAF